MSGGQPAGTETALRPSSPARPPLRSGIYTWCAKASGVVPTPLQLSTVASAAGPHWWAVRGKKGTSISSRAGSSGSTGETRDPLGCRNGFDTHVHEPAPHIIAGQGAADVLEENNHPAAGTRRQHTGCIFQTIFMDKGRNAGWPQGPARRSLREFPCVHDRAAARPPPNPFPPPGTARRKRRR